VIFLGSTDLMSDGIGCVSVATTDEFHQSFVESRSASVSDVLIDSGGAISGLLIGAAFAGHGSKKSRRKPAEIVDARL
jgi:VanZ family protein